MWSGKFTARPGIKGYGILLKGAMESLEDNADETKDKEVTETIQMLNKMVYREHLLSQDDTVCFQIVKESTTE